MNNASHVNGADERFYERLAEYLETRSAGGPADSETIVSDDPDVAAGLADYLDAEQVLDRISAPLREVASRRVRAPETTALGEYELLEEIGRGGTAVVYRARQRGLKRLVAVKMIRGGASGSPYDVERIRFEAEAVASLEHPGIVPVYDIGEQDGVPYFSMKLYEAGSLAGRLADFRGNPREAVHLVESIAQAVHHAHQRGILHRDLKPSNILLDTDGRPQVADFGLAKRIESDQELTRTGELIGTPSYIAPERVTGSPWDAPATIATDVYGLGAILYALLAGEPPFQRATSIETLLAVSFDEVRSPATFNPRVDRDLATICLKCLEKDPARRYASALDVADDLNRWLAGEPIAAREIGRGERLRRWRRRHPVRATAGLAAALLTVVAIGGLIAGYVLVNRANTVAEQHRIDAEQKASELNHRLYASQMTIGFQHQERGELDELRTLLDEFRNQEDVRGFEWRWLDRQARRKPRELVRFVGHQHIVYGGAFSPDGRSVATCGADATIQLWDARTGALQRVFDTGAGLSPKNLKFDEDCVCFSPDGTLLASTCEDGAVRLWTLADGSFVNLQPVPQGETFSVEFSPDGRWLVTASADGLVCVWDVANRAQAAAFSDYVAPARWAAFSPDSGEVASIDQNGNLLIRNPRNGDVRLQLRLELHTYCLAYSPDGAVVATEGANGTVVLWNAANGDRIATLAVHANVRSIDFSRDGTHLACGSRDGDVRVFSLADRKLRRHFNAGRDGVWTVRFAPDGHRLLTTGSDHTARIWELDPSVAIDESTDVADPLRQLVFSPDGRTLAMLTHDGRLLLGDRDGQADWRTAPVPMLVRHEVRPQFSPDGNELAFVGFNGEILRWRCRKQQLLPAHRPPPLHSTAESWKLGFTQLAYLDDNRLLALTSSGTVLLCDSGNWGELRPGAAVDGKACLLASLDGGRLLAMNALDPSRIELWNIEQNRIEETIHCAGRLSAGAASSDGNWLAYGLEDGNIVLIEFQARHHPRTLFGHRSVIASMAFSADCRTLATASSDGTVRLWNVASALEMFVIDSRASAFTVAFSPDGEMLAVGGDPRADGTTLSIFRATVAP